MDEIRKYLAIGLKWWWLLLLAPLVAAPIGYVTSRDEEPVYWASATIIIGQTIQSVDPSSGEFALAAQLAGTYADMARRQPVLQGVVEALNLDRDWGSLKGQVNVSPVAGTQLLEIAVKSGDPDEAESIANEVANQLILLSPTNLQNREQSENQRLIGEQVEKLKVKIETGQKKISELETTLKTTALSAAQIQKIDSEITTLKNSIAGWEGNFTQLLIFQGSKKSANYLAIIEPAQVSPPSKPKVERDIVMAAVAGLFLAAGIIFLIEYLDDSLKSISEISKTLGVVTLGQINRIKGEHYQNKLLTSLDLFSPTAEAYRMIRSNIQFMSIDQPIKSIMVTSAVPGEGKSITVANLGIIMAQANLKTIIVDTDLRRPTLPDIFQLSHNQEGLTELLRTPDAAATEYLRDTAVENLQVLTSGVVPPNPAELLGSHRMGQVVADLEDYADIIIYDSSPTLIVTDAPVLSRQVDGVVLVIQAGRTRRDAAKQVLFNLQQADANLLGVLLNQVPKKRGNYSYPGYYSSAATKRSSYYTSPSPLQKRKKLESQSGIYG